MRRLIVLAFALVALAGSYLLTSTQLCYSWWHGTYCPALTGNPIGAGFALSGQPFFAAPLSAYQVNQSFSLAFWIQTSTFPATGASIIVNSVPNSNGWFVAERPDSFLSSTFSGFSFIQSDVSPGGANIWCGYGNACVSATALSDGQPHLVCMAYNKASSTLTVSLDATVISSQFSGAYTPSTLPISVGQSGFSASFKRVRMYGNYALTQGDCQDLFSYGQVGLVPASGPTTQNLIGDWVGPATSGGTVVADTSSNNNPLIIDTTAPTVVVTAPTNGATVSGTITLTATCTDNIACASVQFEVDGTNVGAALAVSPYTTTFNTALLADGSHVFSALGTDYAGNVGTGSVTVTLNNSVSNKSVFIANAGSDAANCLTSGTACQTIGKALTFTYHAGDTLNFNGGDNFNDACLVVTTTQVPFGIKANPVVIQAYGTGVYTITSSCTGAVTSAVSFSGVTGVTMQGGKVRPGATSPQFGVRLIGGDTVTIQNMDIAGFHFLPTNFGGDIFLAGSGGNNYSLLNNTICGLSGPSSPDDNGISGFNGDNGLLAQGNVICNIGGYTGNAFGGSQGSGHLSGANGLIQYELAHTIGGNTVTCGGPSGIWTAGSSALTIKFSEVYLVQPIAQPPSGGCDWDGYDADINTTNAMFEYLYSHNIWGTTYLAFANAGPNTLRYSIGEDWAINTSIGWAGITMATAGTQYHYNNTLYNGQNIYAGSNNCAVGFEQQNNNSPNGIAANNIFASLACGGQFRPVYNASPGTAATTIMVDNDFYNLSGTAILLSWNNVSYASIAAFQAGYAPATGNISVTAGFSGTYPSGNCSWTPSTQMTWPPSGCPAAYPLSGGSALLGAGKDLTLAPYNLTVGSRDYYGNAIGSPYSIGAYQ